MSKTIQRRSWAELDEPGKDLTLRKIRDKATQSLERLVQGEEIQY
jgi:hypothetical protein